MTRQMYAERSAEFAIEEKLVRIAMDCSVVSHEAECQSFQRRFRRQVWRRFERVANDSRLSSVITTPAIVYSAQLEHHDLSLVAE